jgi:hypothetical protein
VTVWLVLPPEEELSVTLKSVTNCASAAEVLPVKFASPL